MFNSIIQYQNHDIEKVIINNPIQFNLELFIIFGALFFIINKKENKPENFLCKNLTNEIKGVAILAIIIHHLCRHTISNTSDLIIFYDLGYVGVGLFLFLSGFGLTSSLIDKGNENFFLKKIFRIYIPFTFMNLVWVILDYYLLNINQGIFKNIGRVIGIIITDRNYWYIPFLIFWYIIFYFVMNLKIDDKLKVVVLIIVSIIIIINPMAGNGRANAFSFPFGVIIALYKDKVKILYNKVKLKRTNNIKLIFVCGLLMSIFYLLGSVIPRFPMGKSVGIFYIISICAMYFFYRKKIILEKISLIILFVISTTMFSLNDTFVYVSLSAFSLFSILFTVFIINNIKLNKISIVFEFLGKISFELYLIHGALMYSYDFILFKMPIQISFILYLIVIICISIILNKLFNSTNKRLIKLL